MNGPLVVLRLCRDCRHSRRIPTSEYLNACTQPTVVMAHPEALADHCPEVLPGVSCRDERLSKHAPCGRDGKLWEAKP